MNLVMKKAAVAFALLTATLPAFAAQSIVELSEKMDLMWVFLATAMVFMMQAGFSCFEVGMVRQKNITATAFKNVMDWVAVSLTFFVVGYGVMYGSSVGGFLGIDGFAMQGRDG